MKVLVVEDMPMVRGLIVKYLKESEEDIEEIIEAEDGQEGLELIRMKKPDIVLTDIQMPHMSGIELMEEAKKAGTVCEYIIITGYADFNYAKKAIELGVSGYLLKPIQKEKLMMEMDKAVESLSREKNFHLMTSKQHSLKEEMTLAKQLLNPLGEEIQLMEKGYHSMIFFKLPIGKDLEILQHHKEHLRKRLKDLNQGKLIENHHSHTEILLLVCEREKEALEKAIKKILVYMGAPLDVSVICCISSMRETLSYELYKQCHQAYHYRLIKNGEQTFWYQEDERDDGQRMKDKLDIFEAVLKTREMKRIKGILHTLFEPGFIQELNLNHISYYFNEVSKRIIKVLGLKLEKTEYAKYIEDHRRYHRFKDLGDLEAFFVESLEHQIFMSEGMTKGEYLMGRVKNYICDHYQENLSSSKIAKLFFISPSYLSAKFKAETGKTVSQYIMTVKIERACQLLVESQLSVTQIAQTVGYEDVQYFYRIFRKHTQTTPMEYRQRVTP